MSDYTPEVQAEIARFTKLIEDAVAELIRAKDGRILMTEAGMAEIVKACSDLFPPERAYKIAIAELTPDDRRLNRIPAITIEVPRWVTWADDPLLRDCPRCKAEAADNCVGPEDEMVWHKLGFWTHYERMTVEVEK